MTQEECRDIEHAGIRKAKAHLEFNLASDVKNNKKSFYRYMNNKNKSRINMSLLLNVTRNLMSVDMYKTEILNVLSP